MALINSNNYIINRDFIISNYLFAKASGRKEFNFNRNRFLAFGLLLLASQFLTYYF